MLGKLIKNEFRNIGRLLLLINTIVLGMHLLSMVFESVYNSGVLSGTVFQTMFGAFGAIYIFSIIAVNIIIFIIFAVRFYRKVYSVEGYLTHTLPVKKSSIYIAILTSSSVGALITAVVSLVYPLTRIGNEFILANKVELSDLVHLFTMKNITGYTAFILAVEVILSVISAFALIFLCISIGQNWKAHPILGSILAYWGITTALQIAGVIVLVSLANSELAQTIFGVDRLPGDVINALSYCGIAAEVIGIAIMSAGSVFVMKRKLDLQ